MESAFGWLGELFSRILTLLPRLIVVSSVEGGVAFVRGKPRLVAPGRLYLYWPFWTEVLVGPVNRQTLDLRGQSYVTSDGRSVVISVVVVYRINDPLKAFTAAENLDEAIRDVALGAIIAAVNGKTFKELYAGRDDLNAQIRKELVKQLHGWGVDVMRCLLTEFAPCKVLRVIGEAQGIVAIDDV